MSEHERWQLSRVLGGLGASRVVPPPLLFWQVLETKALATLELDGVNLIEEGARQLTEAPVQSPFLIGLWLPHVDYGSLPKSGSVGGDASSVACSSARVQPEPCSRPSSTPLYSLDMP